MHPPDALETIGLLSVTLTPERLEDSLDEALESLRAGIGADFVAVYLAAPSRTELYLTARAGARIWRERYPIGQGVPGLVALDARPVLVLDVDRDARFRGHSDRPHGLRSWYAVPLAASRETFGVLKAAWTRSGGPTDDVRRVLDLAATPIRTAAQAALLGHRRAVADIFQRHAEDLDAAMREVLLRMQDLTGFQAASAYLDDGTKRHRLTDGLDTPCAAIDPFMRGGCPHLGHGRSVVLTGSSQHWPAQCHLDEGNGACRACVPVSMPGGRANGVRLSYADPPPDPTTRWLAALETMADETSLQLQAAHRRAPANGGRSQPRIEDGPRAILEIRCLGRFEVLRDGMPVAPASFRRATALQLLKILLLHAGNPVAREVLSEMLWPGAPPSSGANRLHGAVHALRQAIEPNPGARRWTFISGSGDHYWFNLDAPQRVDFLELKVLLARARALDGQQAVPVLEEACRLYRGDLFEDDPYAEWCWAEREALRDRCLDAHFTLARLYDQLEDPSRSLEHYRSALRLQPLREDVHHSLIESLWRWGRRAEALTQYDDYASLLHRELDATPLPETRQLRDRIAASLR